MTHVSTTATIPAVLTRAVEQWGERDALVDGDTRLTWAELAAAADRGASALVASGVDAGDRVAIWAPNRAEWVIAVLSIWRAGAAAVPINTRFKGNEAHYVLTKSRARLLFTVGDFLGTDYVAMLRAAGSVPSLEEIVVFDAPADGTTSWSELVERAAGPIDRVVGPDDTASVIFTSGTTGAPKGAVLQHGASVWAYETWVQISGLNADDRYLIMNPFFHTFGLKAGILACVITGATIVPHAVFDVSTVLERIAAEQISMFPGPPSVYQSMLDHPERERFDLSTLRLAITGAATVPVEMVRRMRTELPFETILTGYGLTETVGIVTTCRPDDDADTIATTAGRPMPGIEVRIVDADGATLGADDPGEVLVRGPNLLAEYFEDPVATAEAIDGDGWFRTGDIGVVDARGNLRITDRAKDMYIVGGFNAYPAEIENVIAGHPGVSQVAVVGIPDERLGEVGMAFVIARPGVEVDPDEVVAWCREQMANFKVPRRVAIVDELPMNATGKVLKYELRARIATDLESGARAGR